MGNTPTKQIKPFGSVNAIDSEFARPGYFITAKQVKYQGQPIPLLPTEGNFKKLNYGYLTSNLRVFYNGKPIPGADPKTFQIISRKEASKTQFAKLNAVLGKDVVNNKTRTYKFGSKIYEE